jgi:hypothetical protein
VPRQFRRERADAWATAHRGAEHRHPRLGARENCALGM